MPTNGSVTLPTLRTIRRLGANGGVFQSQDVRSDLAYGERSDEAHRMHAVIHRLKRSKVIAAVDESRKRNQYLKVVDEESLRRQIDRAATSKSAASQNGDTSGGDVARHQTEIPSSAPKRVMYLEDRVADLEAQIQKLSGLPADVGMVRAELEETNAKLDQLIDLWS